MTQKSHTFCLRCDGRGQKWHVLWQAARRAVSYRIVSYRIEL